MQTIKEKMQQRMRQILIHSCIYYEFDMNIVDDATYDKWGNELVDLIKKYPQYLKEIEFGLEFKDYVEMPSGFNLPYRHPDIMRKARYLLKLRGLL